jgi:uroporphyrinogen III methyltransferase/synthase
VPFYMTSTEPGIVYLVGAGPGDPGLIAVRGLAVIAMADVIVYDALANPALLAEAPAGVELIDAGKRARSHRLSQDQINELLAEKALAGKTVVRLKGGDPYVFGRGSEEGLYLHGRGIEVQIVPGITAAIAGPACAGIPVTHRQVATTVTFLTGHEDPTKDDSQVDYGGLVALAKCGGTLCVYMGMGRLNYIVDELIGRGLDPSTAAAVVQWGTTSRQRTVRAPLQELVARIEAESVTDPAVIIIGPVAALDEQGALRSFERRPLFGRLILITRTRQQSSRLRRGLEELGAEVIEAPTIRIDSADMAPVDYALNDIGKWDWLVLTSANGVAALRTRLDALQLDARHLAGVKIAVIGDATVESLGAMGLRADFVPSRFVAESLVTELNAQAPVRGKNILMLRADIARRDLRVLFEQAGAMVTDLNAYRTVKADAIPPRALEALREGRVDWMTFTSASTVRNTVELLGGDQGLLEGIKIASIGPITTGTCRELGLDVTTEAARYDVEGLIEALLKIESGPNAVQS